MLELHGDIPGAIKTMELALSAGGGANESTLWTQVQLGNLYFNSGNLRQAEAQYMQALALQPDYVYAAAGLAKVRAATGNRDQAIAIYKNVTERLPLPEFVVALGELYEVTGKQDLARQQYDLVRAMQQLNAGAGMNVDLELSLFEADHGGDPATTVERAQTAYRSRPSIYGADALAWALYRAGRYDEAWRYAQESLRLGTHDANLHFHAGMIALKLGQNADAKRLLGEALAINPNFSVRHAPEARQALLGLK
jgi:tetratricopeptide (TPR) repeat protein